MCLSLRGDMCHNLRDQSLLFLYGNSNSKVIDQIRQANVTNIEKLIMQHLGSIGVLNQ